MSSTRIYLLLVSLALGGCASTQGERNPQDPLEPFNRSMYKLNDIMDKTVLKPVAKGYSTFIPEPGKIMVSNFFSNLDDILVTIHDLLQLKFAQAASDGTRVLFNSTFGVFGLFNVTDRLEKHNEDLGQTLGYWGVSSGPYVVLPFFGPRTIRDSIGLYVDAYASPIRFIPNIPTRNVLYATRAVNVRAGLLDQEKILEEAAIDRYIFTRDAYLQQRQNLVYDGNPPREKFDDEENSDTPDKTLIEDKQENLQPAVDDTPKPEAVGTSIPQSMESPAQQPSSDAASSSEPAAPSVQLQPSEMGMPADPTFNPYRMEQPIPSTTENPVLN
ncbi:MlaA family lipoprotein [Candidatus Nitrotoga sp. HW29]|uniref:MlaA family lipoprotein n=1 Tax=Candidatus Nitrotoga sp. HW29 TaxID=2886963 RepID=UPI001EF2CAE3|nr:VacJ family lipoprotein [Candidatus Nitrotoga sp. HW29]